MAETKKKNKKKKVTISEEDISILLKRYSAATIIALFQEIAQFPKAKIDWNELVKKTSTGISNAREYQMIWRHLAYRDTLLETVDDGAEPLDDNSDLESDLEALPPVSVEASLEAAAYAKVLLGSDLPSDSGSLNRSTVEAPLTINIPTDQASPADSNNPQPACTQGKNITVPVSVQRISLPKGTSTGGLDSNISAGGGLPARRKRKIWTEEEDMELIAAVQRCGERNWANIVKGDFKGDRTASQLSQRWAIIRKRQATTNFISGWAGNPASTQLTEAQLATRRAVSHALNMPMVDNLLAACSAGATQSSIPQSSAAVPSGPEDTSPKSQIQQAPHSKGALNSTSKSRLIAKKGPTVPFKSPPVPNPMIQATAVAAGARIATPSTAASLFKDLHSKNVVHIRPGGGSFKMAIPGGTKSLPTNHSGPRPNIHYIRTSLAPASAPPTYSSPSPSIPQTGSSQQEHSNSTRPQTVTCSFPLTTASSSFPSQQMTPAPSSSGALCGTEEGTTTNVISTVDTAPLSKEDAKSEKMKEDGSKNVPKEFGRGQADLSKLEALTKNQTTAVENLNQSHDIDASESKQLLVASKQSESSNVIKIGACSIVMDED